MEGKEQEEEEEEAGDGKESYSMSSTSYQTCIKMRLFQTSNLDIDNRILQPFNHHCLLAKNGSCVIDQEGQTPCHVSGELYVMSCNF